MFEKHPEPLCILEKKNAKIVEVNQAFCNFIGYSKEDILQQKIDLQDIVYQKDFKNILQRLKHMEERQHLRESLRILPKKGSIKEVEVVLRALQCSKGEWLVCALHDITIYKDMEHELKEKIAQEHRVSIETAKGILRMSHFLEKIHRLPAVLTELSDTHSSQELFQKMAHLLETSLHYATIAIFVVEGEFLNLAYSTKEIALHRFHMKKQHRFAQVARGEKKILAEDASEFILPIFSPSGIEGVLQVSFEETERALIAENEALKKAHGDLLDTLCHFLGLFLVSLRFQKETKFLETCDPVTGISNRQGFLQKMSAAPPFHLLLFRMDLADSAPFEEMSGYAEKLSQFLLRSCPSKAFLGRMDERKFALLVEIGRASCRERV